MIFDIIVLFIYHDHSSLYAVPIHTFLSHWIKTSNLWFIFLLGHFFYSYMYLFCMKDILKFYSYHYKHLIRYACFFLCVMWNKNLNVYFLVIFTWIGLTMYINYMQNVFYIVWLVLKMLQLGNCRFFLIFIWWIEKWFYWERGVKKKQNTHFSG